MIGARAVQHHQKQTEKNREAEESAVRKKLWGAEDVESEDMGHTILGDVIGTPQQQSKGIGTIAALALGASMPMSLVAGAGAMYLWNKSQETEPVIQNPIQDAPPADSPLPDIGLGKIEDYLKD